MKSEDKLYLLIKSLSKSEKRYFKIYATKAGNDDDKSYIKLFDLIDKQKSFNREEILKAFSDEYGTQVTRLKNYLYNLILKWMRMYHADDSIESQINGLLGDISFLYDKKLYAQCEQFITKAKKLATRYELGTELFVILDWEIKLKRMDWQFRKAKPLFIEAETALENIINSFQYDQLLVQIMDLQNTYFKPRNKAQLKKYETLMESALLKDLKNAKSYGAQRKYHQVHFIYNYMVGNKELYYHHCVESTRLLELRPDVIKRDPDTYLTSGLFNIMLAEYDLEYYDKFLLSAEKIEAEISRTDRGYSEPKIRQVRFYVRGLMLSYETNKGEFKKAIPYIELLEQEIDTDVTPEMQKMAVYFNMAYGYFGNEGYSKALKCLNIIFQNKEFENTRQDIFTLAKIFYLIIHFELGNQDLLEYAVKSTYYYLRKRKTMYKFEEAVLDFIRRLPKSKTPSEFADSLKKLKQTLIDFSDDHYTSEALKSFRIIAWIDSKIEKRSFADVIKDEVSSPSL